MVIPSAGEVVLVPFPFSDLSASKLRPAVCLKHAGGSDWILRQITSSRYGDPLAISLDSKDFVRGRLLVASFARPGKLFTASTSLLKRSIGQPTDPAFRRVRDAVVNLLNSPNL